MSKASWSIAVVSGLALAGAGALAGFLLAPQDPPPGLEVGPTEHSVEVTSTLFDDARSVTAVPTLGGSGEVSLATSGRITRLTCEVGGEMVSGKSPVWVNEQPVVALATSLPLWRDLGLNTKGSDVRALQNELNRLGYSVNVNGTYDRTTRTAVDKLFVDAGMGKGPGYLPFAQTLWLPMPEMKITECGYLLGDNADAAAPLAKYSTGLTNLDIKIIPTDAAPGERIVRFYDATASVNEDDTITDESFLATVEKSQEFVFWLQTQQMGGGPEGLEIEYVLTDQITASVVPPGSLFAINGPKACVFDGTTNHPVEIISSSLGKTLVSFPSGNAPASVDLVSQSVDETC